MFYSPKISQVNIYFFAKVSFKMVKFFSFLRSWIANKEDECAGTHVGGCVVCLGHT